MESRETPHYVIHGEQEPIDLDLSYLWDNIAPLRVFEKRCRRQIKRHHPNEANTTITSLNQQRFLHDTYTYRKGDTAVVVANARLSVSVESVGPSLLSSVDVTSINPWKQVWMMLLFGLDEPPSPCDV
jgi:hypothetical protein